MDFESGYKPDVTKNNNSVVVEGTPEETKN